MASSKVKVLRLYQQVAEKLVALIDTGNYTVGMRLPAERDLASMFGVSRPTIREAVIALELEGYVKVRMGSGVYVIENSRVTSRFADKDIGPFDLTEARALFEGEAAALAATMITDEELALLSETLEEMACENNNDTNSHEAADKRFHMIIAGATKNTAIMSVIEELWDEREHSILTKRMYEKVRDSGLKPSVEEHREVYKALKAHDADSSRRLMREHLMRVIDDILEATEIEAVEDARDQSRKARERYRSF
ncbi:exu regulon transcriptional regulator [Glaciecola punicea ACAM 611]|jgi:DNA-binding FadR family transcriptional regulator|uniref:Exu regulon transcriptional regulator n=1 Tax=Glaciecola punicea ACAM 611 TaxID=1121923 RepID=H5TE99_9ALTE|nr:FadR/GntR family transcriptional regulator [Glaciecola punicea]GAB56626.1 exu regulon transcriptional regulator [Glaciecola punicea ACAM 611]